ncbi:MAG: moaC [Chloroflexi bacterium]|nr:moaC [Chloroflexota bacterium]
MPITHLDDEGRAHMVDVSDKPVTAREATAQATVHLGPVAAKAVRDGAVKKGDVLAVAQVAGVMAAKSTSTIIPLCHPLPLSGVALRFTWEGDNLHVVATVRTTGQTGVEMEALTAVTVAALTVYDMVKALERGIRIGNVGLLHKSGGQTGDWHAAGAPNL